MATKAFRIARIEAAKEIIIALLPEIDPAWRAGHDEDNQESTELFINVYFRVRQAIEEAEPPIGGSPTTGGIPPW